jgi:hypothetical protein
MLHATVGGSKFLVVPFPPRGSPLLGCLLAWTLVLTPCFFFSPFIVCFLFTEFGRVSSSPELDQAPRVGSIHKLSMENGKEM